MRDSGRAARPAPRPRRGTRRPAGPSNRRSMRAVERRHATSRSPTWATPRRRVRRRGPGPNEENGWPLPSETSSARTIRRRFVGVIASRRDRIERVEPGVERRDIGLGFELGRGRPAIARRLEPVDHGPEVEAGAADEHARGGRARRSRRAPRRTPRGSRTTVKSSDGSARSMQVVRHLGPLGGRGLGGADVHAPVHLHRVDRHELDARDARARRPGRAPTCPTRSGPTMASGARTQLVQSATTGMRVRCVRRGEHLDQLALRWCGGGAGDSHARVGAGPQRRRWRRSARACSGGCGRS